MAPSNLSVCTYLFNKDGEALIFKRFGELNVLGSLVVYSQGSYNHVSQAPQELSHHAVPLFLVTVVYLEDPKGGIIRRIKCKMCSHLTKGCYQALGIKERTGSILQIVLLLMIFSIFIGLRKERAL